MNLRNVFSSLKVAFLSQSIALFTSATMSFLVPKLLGIEEFGYWQLFLFYSSYSGFFLFGLNDGVYLLKGGQTRKEIDKPSVKTQVVIGFVGEIAISACFLVSVLLSGFFGERSFVIISVAIYLVIYNMAGFFGSIYQAINEPKIYSKSVIIAKGPYLVCLAALLMLRIDVFEPYVVAYIACQTISLVYCWINFSDFRKTKMLPLHQGLSEGFRSVKVGIKLLIANLASMLVIGIARLLVDTSWGIEDFAVFSFALSLSTFFLTFIQQVSMVLFPALRQTEEDFRRKFYIQGRQLYRLVSPIVFVLYFPISIFISFWLPDYAAALGLFFALLPLCLFDGRMQMLNATYLKINRDERYLMVLNLSTVFLGFVLTEISIMWLHSLEAVAAFISLAIFIRCMIAEKRLARTMHFRLIDKMALEELILLAIFAILMYCGLNAFSNFILASLVYLLFLYINRNAVTYVVKRLQMKLSRTAKKGNL